MTDQTFGIITVIFIGLLVLQVYVFNTRGVKMLIPFLVMTTANLIFLLAPIDLAEDSFEYAVLTLLLFVWFDMIPLAIYKVFTFKRSFIRALELAHIMPSERNVKKLAQMFVHRRIKFEWFFKYCGDYLPMLKELHQSAMNSTDINEVTQDLLEGTLRKGGFDPILNKR